VLHTLFSNHELEHATALNLFQLLLNSSRINLSKATRSSIPGILSVFRLIAQHKKYCPLLLEVNNGQVVEMLAGMVALDEFGGRPLPACYRIWVDIMTGLLLEEEQEELMVE
jgi:hypothetical protein